MPRCAIKSVLLSTIFPLKLMALTLKTINCSTSGLKDVRCICAVVTNTPSARAHLKGKKQLLNCPLTLQVAFISGLWTVVDFDFVFCIIICCVVYPMHVLPIESRKCMLK